MSTELNQQTFPDFISSGLALVDFWAPWCGPCRLQAPILDQVAAKVPWVKIGKVNVDDNGPLATQFGVNTIPYLVIFKQGPWSGCGRLSVEQSQLIMRTPFMDNELVALSYQAPEQAITSNRTSLRLIQDCNPALSAILTDRGIGITDNPFLFLIRFYYAFLIRSEYYYNQGMPHWLTRIDNMLSPLHLEKLFLGQNKFHHYRVWFRRELAQYVLDVLSDKQTCTRSYLSRAFVEKMVSDHMKGLKNYTSEINMILTIELTQRLLVDL